MVYNTLVNDHHEPHPAAMDLLVMLELVAIPIRVTDPPDGCLSALVDCRSDDQLLMSCPREETVKLLEHSPVERLRVTLTFRELPDRRAPVGPRPVHDECCRVERGRET